jgi:hypothetical protein
MPISRIYYFRRRVLDMDQYQPWPFLQVMEPFGGQVTEAVQTPMGIRLADRNAVPHQSV